MREAIFGFEATIGATHPSKSSLPVMGIDAR